MNKFIPTSEEISKYREDIFIDPTIPEDAIMRGYGGLSPTSFKKGNVSWKKGKTCNRLADLAKERAVQRRLDNPNYDPSASRYVKKDKADWNNADNTSTLNKTILTCPHCSKTGNVGNMKRWHFDNCGNKREILKDEKGRFTSKT